MLNSVGAKMRTSDDAKPVRRLWMRATVLLLLGAAAPLQAQTPPAPANPNLNNTFNTPPVFTGNKNSISVAIHGYTSSPAQWSTAFEQSIANLYGNKWDTWAFDWSQDAAGTAYAPTTTNIINAQLQGQFLAKTIIDDGYTNVHLYGHSLGGRVVQTAATILAQAPDAPKVQTTFLDPYTPSNWNLIYGTNAAWSDEIVNTTDWAGTNSYLPNASNVDVTAAGPLPKAQSLPNFTNQQQVDAWSAANTAGHSWPYQWYQNTISNYNANNPGYSGLGFGQSMEAQGANWPPNSKPGSVTVMAQDGKTIASTSQLAAVGTINMQSLDPGSANAVLNKSSDNVEVGENSISIDTDANDNEWVNLSLNLTAPINYIDFKFDFSTDDDGALSMRIDNSLLWAGLDEFALTDDDEDSGPIMMTSLSGLKAGQHTLSFRLDTSGDEDSDVDLSDITMGQLVAPEPSTLAVASAAAAILARRRTRQNLVGTFGGKC